MRKLIGESFQPVNPHAQRLQVAAHKQVRQLALPKGKAKAKCKPKAKAKNKASPAPKAKGKTKEKAKKTVKVKDEKASGSKSRTLYGQVKSEYFEWSLGPALMYT